VSAFLQMTVPGRPVPKARPRMGANGHVYTPAETKAAEGAIGWAARSILRGRRPASGPLLVTAVFYVADRRRRDVDNLLKTVMDGLNRIAWDDDSQVVQVSALIVLDRLDPHTEVTVTELPGVPCALTAPGSTR
jgi:crossover junction endodeoxyribonuclease RusA